MRRLAAVLPLFVATFLILMLPHDAEARRMGGGSNLGKQYSVPKRDTTSSTTSRQDVTPNTVASAPRTSGASRWLGPLAGLAAGGLIAALLFGDGFQGFQFFDFVVIAALAFGVMMLLRAMRSRPVLQPAGGPSLGEEALQEREIARGYSAAAASDRTMQAPAWFNAESFLKGARVHFIRLQAAWDKGDMKDIATYTTPELYAELQAQRLASGNESHYTEVGYLDAELLGVQRDGDNTVATIRFFGGIREEQNGEMQEFNELWHVIHAWDTPKGDWYVAGIQQVEAP